MEGKRNSGSGAVSVIHLLQSDGLGIHRLWTFRLYWTNSDWFLRPKKNVVFPLTGQKICGSIYRFFFFYRWMSKSEFCSRWTLYLHHIDMQTETSASVNLFIFSSFLGACVFLTFVFCFCIETNDTKQTTYFTRPCLELWCANPGIWNPNPDPNPDNYYLES